MNSIFPGELDWTGLLGKFGYAGEVIPLNAGMLPGNNLWTKTAGDACYECVLLGRY